MCPNKYKLIFSLTGFLPGILSRILQRRQHLRDTQVHRGEEGLVTGRHGNLLAGGGDLSKGQRRLERRQVHRHVSQICQGVGVPVA